MAGNVNLIDPNSSNINNNITNGIPQYQDMYISVGLTAVQRERTVLATNMDTDVTKIVEKSTQEGKLVSFLGQNQDPDNTAHFNKFTTNYYDGATEREKTFEGFGINSIDIVTNSSYIPQVDIEFIDIRGLAFFNRENSPYRILFDFPPPIFYLTYKGYYGKGITYQMHLVKYNTEFKAETGNYHIKAQFIAITYAPLTDVLFRYVIQSPLMFSEETTLSPDSTGRPKNTFDLILKLENIYSTIPEKIKTDVDNIRYENAQKKLNSYDNVLEILYNFKTRDALKIDSGNAILFTENQSEDESTVLGEIDEIPTFTEYDEYLETFGTRDLPRNIEKRLYIGYKVKDIDTNSIPSERNNTLKEKLDEYKEKLVTSTRQIVSGVNLSDINDAENIYSSTGAKTDNSKYVQYVGIDITTFYAKIYKNRFILQDKKKNAMNGLNTKINNMIQERLGMLPTIYNIFEILLNDVDDFFTKLKTYSIKAEEHHEKYKKFIINDGTYKDVKNVDDPKIYPFPLLVRREKVCNQTKEVRTAPIDISDRIDQQFPELLLVQEFIDSFIRYNRVYKQATLKDEKDAKGDYKWIPISPVDSTLISSNINSPYYGTDSSGGGSSQEPIDLSESDKLSQIFKILLERFYLLSQNSFAYSFYGIVDENNIYSIGGGDDNQREEKVARRYIELYAKTEAINLANSITNEQYAKLLKEFSTLNSNPNKLNNTTNGFYAYLEKYVTELYTQSPSFYTVSNGYDLYRNKTNDKYNGLAIIDTNDIAFKSNSSGNDDFEEFIENNKTSWLENIFKRKRDIPEEHFEFTQENAIYIKDSPINTINEDNNLKTKFLLNNRWLYKKITNEGNSFGRIGDEILPLDEYKLTVNEIWDFPYEKSINNLSNVGNKFFALKKYNGENNFDYVNIVNNKQEDYENIREIWLNNLIFHDTEIYDYIIKYEDGSVENADLTAIIYLSNFGFTLSPFNYFPNGLNPSFFTKPAIIEAPKFVQLYMGALVGIEKGDDLYDSLYDFFVTGSGNKLESGGALIFADIHDINTYLSDNDKEILKQRYLAWFNDNFNSLASSIDSLYKKIHGNGEGGLISETCENEDDIECKIEIYTNELTNSVEYADILTNLIERVGFAIFNEITFRYTITPDPSNYVSLQSQNQNNNIKTLNDIYFSTLFGELSRKIQDRLDYLKEETQEFKNSTGDHDILTQTYYSFKNLNDKWLSGFNKDITGYPFKTDKSSGLISQFAFVDRAMNPIGDTIIDPKSLIDAKDSPDLSIFTVISQLLSLNGFEFFPLQNFLKFKENEWEESFNIDTSGTQKEYPVFICMYIGGTSSYPSGMDLYKRPFENDGIIDLQNPNVSDFLSEDCAPDPDKDRQTEVLVNDGEFLNEVRAFRVRYGEQNQNMFFDFAVDSKEYPETNESIQILSRLAGDNKLQAPVPKGQNLYNLYENRAYRATITGFGNAMIQPTQYFQLENVPLYNGAYVILTVEHNITPNKMTTKFSGTKLLKYPMPRVKNPASIIGFDGGSTDETNADAASSGEVTLGVGTAGNPNQAQYNSMYTLKIY